MTSWCWLRAWDEEAACCLPPPSAGTWSVAGAGGQGHCDTCLAPLGPVIAWWPSASWAASIPLGECGEISLMSLGHRPQGRTLEGPGHVRPLQHPGAHSRGAGPPCSPAGDFVRHRPCPMLAPRGKGCFPAPPVSWVARGVDAGSPSDASHGLRGRTPQAPESLLKGPLEAWEERGSGHTVLTHVSGEPWVDSPRPPALQGWFSRASPLLSSAGQPPPEPHVRQGAGPRGALTLLWLPTLAPWSPGSPGLPASPM